MKSQNKDSKSCINTSIKTGLLAALSLSFALTNISCSTRKSMHEKAETAEAELEQEHNISKEDKQRLRQAEADLARAKSLIQSLEEEKSQSRMTEQERQITLDEFQKTIMAYEETMDNLKKSILELNEKRDGSREEFNTIQAHLESLQEKQASVESEIQTLSTQKSELENEILKNTSASDNMKTKLKDIADQISLYAEVFHNLDSEIEKKKELLPEPHKKVLELEEKHDELIKKINDSIKQNQTIVSANVQKFIRITQQNNCTKIERTNNNNDEKWEVLSSTALSADTFNSLKDTNKLDSVFWGHSSFLSFHLNGKKISDTSIQQNNFYLQSEQLQNFKHKSLDVIGKFISITKNAADSASNTSSPTGLAIMFILEDYTKAPSQVECEYVKENLNINELNQGKCIWIDNESVDSTGKHYCW